MQRLTVIVLVAAGLAAAALLGYVALQGPGSADPSGSDSRVEPPPEPDEPLDPRLTEPLPEPEPAPSGASTAPKPRRVPAIEDIEGLLKAGYRTEALDLLDARIERFPDDARAREIRGGLLLEKGSYRQSAKDLRISIQKGGESCEKLVTFASALYRHDYRGARKALRRAIELDPRAARPHSLLAQIHLRRGEEKEAKEEVRKALSLDSREPLAVSLSQRLLR